MDFFYLFFFQILKLQKFNNEYYININIEKLKIIHYFLYTIVN
jgi:hypothetical protein